MCLIASKSKVAPLKDTSIPRLELLACVLLVKLAKEIKALLLQQLKGCKWYAWSDSKVALYWIRGKVKCWKPWVENRVVYIREIINENNWNYIQSEDNPADIPTRVDKIETFTPRSWFDGPKFLYEENYVIPKFDIKEKASVEETLRDGQKEK